MTPTWLHWPSTASWTPADLADLRAWYKADAITGLSDGDPVSTWSDSSGGGYDITQTSTARPLYQTNTLNGLPVVEFDGSNDFLQASTASDWNFLHHTGGSTVAAVWKAGVASDPNTVYGLIGNMNDVVTTHGFQITYDDRASLSRNDRIASAISNSTSTLTVGQQSANGTHTANAAHLVTCVSDPGNATAASRSSLRVDGGTAIENNTSTGTASTTNASEALCVGSVSSAKWFLNGYIAEVVICDALLSSTDREKLEGYLAHKWGIESNLPGTHPYKSSAP